MYNAWQLRFLDMLDTYMNNDIKVVNLYGRHTKGKTFLRIHNTNPGIVYMDDVVDYEHDPNETRLVVLLGSSPVRTEEHSIAFVNADALEEEDDMEF